MRKIRNLIFGTSIILTMAIIGYRLSKEENIFNSQKATNAIGIDKNNDVLSPTLLATLSTTIEDKRKLVALTFDDGPSKYTEELIKVLDDYNIKATFFILGCNCSNYPNTLSVIANSGHEIAIHGNTHLAFTNLSLDQVDEEINTTINYVEELGIDVSYLVRPPYGSLNDKLKENIDYPFILWNIDTEDWKTKDKEKIEAEILENIQEGSIILMHDTNAVHDVDLEVLKEILPNLISEYNFVTISELANHFDIQLENGKTYGKIKSEN